MGSMLAKTSSKDLFAMLQAVLLSPLTPHFQKGHEKCRGQYSGVNKRLEKAITSASLQLASALSVCFKFFFIKKLATVCYHSLITILVEHDLNVDIFDDVKASSSPTIEKYRQTEFPLILLQVNTSFQVIEKVETEIDIHERENIEDGYLIEKSKRTWQRPLKVHAALI